MKINNYLKNLSFNNKTVKFLLKNKKCLKMHINQVSYQFYTVLGENFLIYFNKQN